MGVTTLPAQQATEDALSEVVDLRDSPDMTDAPIQIWVYRAGGQVRHVRVVGHATQEICEQVSERLAFAAANPAVKGFLTFGVADLAPASDPDAFARVVGPMLDEISALAETTDYVHMHEVQRDFVDSLPAIRVPAGMHHTLAVESKTAPGEGPQFIPVRTWEPGHEPMPVVFRLSWQELGLDTPVGRQLGADMALAPWIESLERTQTLVQEFDSFIEWRKAGKRLDPDVVAFTQVFPEHSSDFKEARSQVEAAIATIDRAYAAVLAAQAYGKVAETFRLDVQVGPGIDKLVKELRDALRYDHGCLDYLRHSRVCSSEPGAVTGHFESINLTQPDPELRNKIEAVNDALDAIPVDAAIKAREEVVQSVNKQRAEIATLQRAGVSKLSGGRTRVVDGVLRGWAIPTDDAARASAIDSVIATNVPAVWERVVRELSPATFSPDPLHNSMIDPHVFYEVHDLGSGEFEVRPEYIVYGRFFEVWNPQSHTVTIQAEEKTLGEAQ